MKLLLLLFLISLFSTEIFAQLRKTESAKFVQISEVRENGRYHSELKYTLIDKDTLYCLLYNNGQYTRITDVQSICFNHEPGILDSLYSTLLSTFDKPKEDKITFKLGKVNIVASANKTYMVIGRMDNNSYLSLSKKQLKKLFNK